MMSLLKNRKPTKPDKLLDIKPRPCFFYRHQLLYKLFCLLDKVPFMMRLTGMIMEWNSNAEEKDNREASVVGDVKRMLSEFNEATRDRFHHEFVMLDEDGMLTLHYHSTSTFAKFTDLECCSVREMYFLLCGLMAMFENPKRNWLARREASLDRAPHYHVGKHETTDPADVESHPIPAQMYGIYCDNYLMCGDDPNGITGLRSLVERPAWRVVEATVHGDRYVMMDMDMPGLLLARHYQLAHVILADGLQATDAERVLAEAAERTGLPVLEPLFLYFGYTRYKQSYYEQCVV